VVLVVTDDQGSDVVTVVPVTHTPPSGASLTVEIPHATQQRLGLDGERSWVVLTEANRFVWPGPDLRMREAGGQASVAYGLLPRALFREIRDRLGAGVEAGLARVVRRTH
jgi:hypothetical protein